MLHEIAIDDIDITAALPEDELQRQHYYIAKVRRHVAALAEKIGRVPTCCVTTFGCQMSTVHET